MTVSKPSVLLVEELQLNREALAGLISSWSEFEFAGAPASVREALEIALTSQPQIAILDASFSGLYCLELVRQFREVSPNTRCVVLAPRADSKPAADAIRAGAAGFAVRTAPSSELREILAQVQGNNLCVSPELEVTTALRAAVRPQTGNPIEELSTREHQVFRLLVEGIKPKEVAARLQVSTKTVDSYRANVMRKLNVRDFATLVRVAVEHERTQIAQMNGERVLSATAGR